MNPGKKSWVKKVLNKLALLWQKRKRKCNICSRPELANWLKSLFVWVKQSLFGKSHFSRNCKKIIRLFQLPTFTPHPMISYKGHFNFLWALLAKKGQTQQRMNKQLDRQQLASGFQRNTTDEPLQQQQCWVTLFSVYAWLHLCSVLKVVARERL